MIFEEKTILLKDGRKCVLKPTSPEYAEEMIEYMKRTAVETPFLLRYPDEVKYSVEGEREILGSLYEDPYSIMMVAIVDGKVAGNGSINGVGTKRKIIHRCSLAIALYKEYWGQGIGTAMINYMSELAAMIGWSQVDLEVVAENVNARAVYKKCGFIETGRHHNAIREEDGTYHDYILMYKDLCKSNTDENAESFMVDYCGCMGLYEGAKESYKAGEKVCLQYGIIATDTDYSFLLDDEPLRYRFENGAFLIEFIMPDHDVKLSCKTVNTMTLR